MRELWRNQRLQLSREPRSRFARTQCKESENALHCVGFGLRLRGLDEVCNLARSDFEPSGFSCGFEIDSVLLDGARADEIETGTASHDILQADLDLTSERFRALLQITQSTWWARLESSALKPLPRANQPGIEVAKGLNRLEALH